MTGKIVAVVLVIVLLGAGAYAIYSSRNADTFQRIFGVGHVASTDAQRTLIQADVKKTLVELAVRVSDLQAACDGKTADQVQSCTKEKLDSLKPAESNFEDAGNIAIHYGYDSSYTQEDLDTYRKANAPPPRPTDGGGPY
jgi:hypothetical protein